MADQRGRLSAIARYLKAAQDRSQVQGDLQRTMQACDCLAAVHAEDTLDEQVRALLDTATAIRHEHEEQANDLNQARTQVLQYTQKAEAEAKALVMAAEARLQAEVTALNARIQSTTRDLQTSTNRLDQLLAYQDHLASMRN